MRFKDIHTIDNPNLLNTIAKISYIIVALYIVTIHERWLIMTHQKIFIIRCPSGSENNRRLWKINVCARTVHTPMSNTLEC